MEKRMHRKVASLAVLLILVGATPAAAQRAARAATADAGSVTFTVRIENVARRVLTLANGVIADIPLSAGVWAVHTAANPIFTPGEVQSGTGLKGLAEAGMADAFAPNLRRLPGVRSAGAFQEPLGRPRGRMAMRSAEGGGANTTRMLQAGQHFEFTVTAQPGDRLSLALMLSQSNDGLMATGADGMALFDAAGRPVSGNFTTALFLWDAGTEVNEEPGLGRNQGLRQGAPHAGDPERRPVRPIRETEYGDRWPAVDEIVKLTITPRRN
jgi:hypothetical protein